MPRTPEGKRIRIEYLQGSVTAPDDEIVENILLDSFTPQFDIRVVGWHFENELQVVNAIGFSDNAYVRAATFLSRGAAADFQSRWATLHSAIYVQIETGGMISPNILIQTEDVMFPEGHGIDIDEGESVYIFGTCRNVAAGLGMAIIGTCVLYWVPR